MLNTEALQELLDFKSTDPVLSVYLDTDLTKGNFNRFQLDLRRLLRGVEMAADEKAILEYYSRDRRWSGKSLAMFSCAPEGFFRAYPFSVPVRSLAFAGSQPYVKPLVDLMDAHGDYAAVLVDKQKAWLFLSHLGDIEEHDGFTGRAVKHVKRGGASSFPGRRAGVAGRTDHAEEIVNQNLKEAAQMAVRWFEQQRVRRVLLGGTEESVQQFKAALPKAWQTAVIGTFALGMRAGTDDVRKKIREVGDRASLEREAALVSRMITASAKGGAGVAELEDTLRALREGRIQVLLISEGFQAPGFRCKGCGYLTTKQLGACPFCGNEFTPIDDAVELAIREAMQAGGEIEIVRKNPDLEQLKIGAILRF